jgi:hypothetical protein
MATKDFVVKNGLDVTEAAVIRDTTDSSSKDTGALVVEGGVGIEKKLYVGTDLVVSGTAAITGNTTLTGDIAVNGGDITTNQTTFNLIQTTATTLNVGGAATTLNVGASSGTTNVRNNLNVVGDVDIDGGDLTASTSTFNLINTTATTLNIGGAATSLNLGAATGALTVNNSRTVFNSTNSIQVPVGTTAQRPSPLVAGQIRYNTDLATFEGYGPGNNWVAMIGVRDIDGNTFIIPETSPGANNNRLDFYANGTFALSLNSSTLDVRSGTTLVVSNDTEASSTTTGSVQIAGGVGIAKRLYAGSIQNTPIGSSVANTAAFTTLTANGAVTFTQNTASTTTTSGTLVVSGGIGVTGAINTGLSSSFNGLTSTNTTVLSPANATVTISPTGTGTVTIAPATTGSIDNVNVGATTAATGRFTTLTTTSTTTLSPANANVLIQPTGTGAVTISPATAGTINNMSIGATTATTGRFTTVQSTVATGTAPFIVASTTAVTNLNADLLDGFNSSQANTASTVAVRDGSGDIVVRLVRSEFTNESTISGAMAYRVNSSTDNYIRFCSDTPAIRTFLNVPTRTGGDATGTWAISISGNAATVTNGVYTTGNQNIGGQKTFTAGAGAITITNSDIRSNATSTWTGDPGAQGKIQYHSNRWYIVADQSSDRIVQFRRNGTDVSHIDNSGNFTGNAATVTNGVYTTGDQTIGGNKVFSLAVRSPNFYDSTGTYNVNLGSGGSEGRGLVAGYSGGSYGGIGYNIRHTATGATYIAPSADTVSYLVFNSGGFTFQGAAAGTAGRTPTLATRMSLDSSNNLTVAGTITEQSSIVYKENVNPIDNALDKVLKLVGVTYDRKDGTKKNEPGLIAEEVAAVIPSLVLNNDQGNPNSISYSKLTAYLVECIKELNAKIEKLEGKQ